MARAKPDMLLRGQRSDIGNAAAVRTASVEHLDRRGNRGFAAPRDIGLVGDEARLWRVIDPLHEQRVTLTGRKHADRLGGYRPLRQPLHRRAEAIGAAEDQMIAVMLGE